MANTPVDTDLVSEDTQTGNWVGLATDFAEDLRTGAAAADANGELDPRPYEQLRDLGITSAMVPTEAGGAGATHAEIGQVLRALATGDPAVAVTLSMHSHLLAFQVWRHKHGQDASAVFGKVLDGALLVSTGAADWVSSNGTTKKVDGGFRVSARKAPASGCEIGTIMVSSFRWEDAPEGPSVIHCAVPFSAEGVSIDKTWDTLGLRATGSHTIVLDDVFVPEAAVSLIRPADVWHPVWNGVVGAALPLISAAYLGIADRAVELAIGAATGSEDPTQFQLVGEMLNARTTAADSVNAMFTAADNLEFANTDEIAASTFSRKTIAAQNIIQTVEMARELVGGASFQRSHEMERLLRDAHGVVFHPLPAHRQAQFTGRIALGLSPLGQPPRTRRSDRT
jgi:acyl-CoA dehydrogenase